jgi:hypothetical protein
MICVRIDVRRASGAQSPPVRKLLIALVRSRSYGQAVAEVAALPKMEFKLVESSHTTNPTNNREIGGSTECTTNVCFCEPWSEL